MPNEELRIDEALHSVECQIQDISKNLEEFHLEKQKELAQINDHLIKLKALVEKGKYAS